jgi:hypothetical protein
MLLVARDPSDAVCQVKGGVGLSRPYQEKPHDKLDPG